MDVLQVRAYWIASELALEAVAKHFGISRKSKWEDFLALGPENLTGVIADPKGKTVHLFPFGCVVGFGLAHHEIVDLVNYLRRVEPKLQDPQEPFADDWILQVGAPKLELRDDRISIPVLEEWVPGILSTVLSKSVALEKIESEIVRLLDEAEPVVAELSSGKIPRSDARIARISGRILSFRVDTVAYIQLLDKPDATWENPDAEDLYSRLAQFFELHDRYEKIQAKSTVLMDFTEVVASFSHHRNGARLEWAVILLILFEIVLTLVQMLFLRGH